MSRNSSNQQATIKSVFDAFAPEYVELFMDLKKYTRGVTDFALSFGDNPTLLDLGCGPGNIASAIIQAKPNAQLIGVDLSPRMIELAKQQVPEGKFYEGNISEPSNFGKNFDGVILGFVLPYLDVHSTKELLMKVNEVTNPSGYLLMLTMVDEETKTIVKTNQSMDDHSIEITYYSINDLKKMIINSGYQLIQEEQFVNEYNGENEVLIIAKKA